MVGLDSRFDQSREGDDELLRQCRRLVAAKQRPRWAKGIWLWIGLSMLTLVEAILHWGTAAGIVPLCLFMVFPLSIYINRLRDRLWELSAFALRLADRVPIEPDGDPTAGPSAPRSENFASDHPC